ncbi:hypothetical protein H0H93_012544 [Arthromyces matolae]|nr:hypothetical protein H0H93_012544 [Arthromyces matolae]
MNSLVPTAGENASQIASTDHDLEEGEIVDETISRVEKDTKNAKDSSLRRASTSELVDMPIAEPSSPQIHVTDKDKPIPNGVAEVDVPILSSSVTERSRTLSPLPQIPTSPPAVFDQGVAVPTLSSPCPHEELEMAKDDVLDLLGWGVPPEYLVECGISSPVIYRIFTDLHLRLPSNLSMPYVRPR